MAYVKSRSPKQVAVKRRRPEHQILLFLGLFLLLSLTSWFGYRYGVAVTETPPPPEPLVVESCPQPVDSSEIIAEMRQRIADLELSGDADAVAEMRQRIFHLEMGGDIEYQVTEELRATIGGLQDEVAALEEEIRFYKGLMSPGDGEAGLRIEQFSLRPGLDEGRVRFSLLLIQVAEKHQEVQGEVRAMLNGTRNGSEESLDFTSLMADEQSFNIRFRYFYDLTGEISVPDNFIPSSVLVNASFDRRRKKLEQEFAWELEDG